MAEAGDEFNARLQIVAVLVIVMGMVLVSRLFQVQIIDHRENVERLESKLSRVENFMSGRGKIITRDGVVLAHDAPSYQLQCKVSELSFSESLAIVEQVDYYLSYKAKRHRESRAKGFPRPVKAALLKKIENLMPRLKRERLLLDMAHRLNLDIEDLAEGVMASLENCVKTWAYMRTDQVLDIYLSAEAVRSLLANPDRYSGFSCIESSIREYPQKEVACHIVGYMGRLSERNYNVLRVKGIYPHNENATVHPIRLTDMEATHLSWVRNFHVGVSGVEWIFNDHLRGRLHSMTYRRDLGRFEEELSDIVEGQDLQLTLDFELQVLARDLLKGRKGAVVLFDLDQGDILVSASLPSYDPNLITPPVEVNYGQYIRSRQGMLVNRCFGNHYPFGSIYKIVTSVAVLEEGIATPESTFYCSHVHEKTKLKCLGYHTDINVKQALKKSCNIYFYEAAMALGSNKLYNWGMRFGLGKPVGIGFPYEKSGVNPNRVYKRDLVGEMWYPGDTCHMAIGQGFQLGSPLQAAVVAGLVARREPMARPRLWRRRNVPALNLNLKASTLSALREGMYLVVNHPKGTAHASVSEDIIFAGKTGTADVYRQEPHAWFAGYAPFEHPRVAISVIVENGGHGGDEAAPIAKVLLEAWQEKYGTGRFEN
jgi:penicillin-binding protein 2